MLVFCLYNPEQLPKAALVVVHNDDNQVYVSIVLLWEIVIKCDMDRYHKIPPSQRTNVCFAVDKKEVLWYIMY